VHDIFADTAGWGHLIDSTQAYHSVAAKVYRRARQQGRKLITTNYIIMELVALLTSPLRIPRKTTIEFIQGLRTSPHVEIVHIDRELDDRAWQLLAERPDKDWSLVDCASFTVMQERGISEAFTTDRHFEQAGFVCLLKS
jgi:predicted nucleic acid-binding protein